MTETHDGVEEGADPEGAGDEAATAGEVDEAATAVKADEPGGGVADPADKRRPRRSADSGVGKSRTTQSLVARKVVAPRARPSRRAREAEAAVRRLRRTAIAIGVWAVVFALLAGAAWYLMASQKEAERARQDATSAAVAAAQAIFSYDYRSFGQSVSNGREFVTGKFKKEYLDTTGSLEATAKKEKAVVRAVVKSTSVTEASRDRVVVLLYVNQFRRNVNINGEKLDQNRVVLTMVRVHDEQLGVDDWLVSNAVAV